jgi:hypothetical protein
MGTQDKSRAWRCSTWRSSTGRTASAASMQLSGDTDGRMMLRQIMDGWRDFQDRLLPNYWAALVPHGLDSRAIDTFGTLLAAAELVVGPEAMEEIGLPVTEEEQARRDRRARRRRRAHREPRQLARLPRPSAAVVDRQPGAMAPSRPSAASAINCGAATIDACSRSIGCSWSGSASGKGEQACAGSRAVPGGTGQRADADAHLFATPTGTRACGTRRSSRRPRTRHRLDARQRPEDDHQRQPETLPAGRPRRIRKVRGQGGMMKLRAHMPHPALPALHRDFARVRPEPA